MMTIMIALICSILVPASQAKLVKGISYGPMPCKGPCPISQDDFFSQDAKPMWGRRGRGDLEVMKQLGANAVRLYGNNPQNTHWDFLDEAKEFGLEVIPGLSDYDFIQSPNNCLTTAFDCYSQVKESFKANLKGGFLLDTGTYHPALREIIVINEPDLKLPGMHDPKNFSKGIISAIDGMLDAEKEMNVTGTGVNFTVAFSFGVCSTCSEFRTRPSLGQMSELKAAMLAPETVGYQPHNNLGEFYRTRFHNSFNTNNPAEHVKSMFLDEYEHAFPTTPVMIQEYHNPHQRVHHDLKKILEIAEASPLLNGISFFEFNVRYDKGGTEMDFGMFQLGNFSIADFSYFGDGFQAWCLTPHKRNGEVMPDALAEAYGGERLDSNTLCTPNAEKVPLTAAGFKSIHSQNAERKAVFVERLVKHLGGSVLSQDSLRTFVASFSSAHSSKKGPHTQFDNLVDALLSKPGWASWDDSASCVADRDSHAPAIGNAIGEACGGLTTFDCDEIPDACRKSVWDVADYVFGIYFAEHKGSALQTCYFNGAATLAGTPQHMSESKPECVIPVSWKPKRRLEDLLTSDDFQDSRLAIESSIMEEENEEAPSLLAPAMLGCLAAAIAVSLLIACGFSRPTRKFERQISPDLEKVPSQECLAVKMVPGADSTPDVEKVPSQECLVVKVVVAEVASNSPTDSSPN